MKNVVIVVLLIVVIALGFLLYKNRSAGGGIKNLKMTRTAGATHQRTDHNGKSVNTQDCNILVGQNNEICIIPISYLRNMAGQDNTALEVHHNDIIIWYGDAGESLDVQPMAGVDCSNHGQPDPPPNGDASLINTLSSPGVLQFAQVTNNGANDLFCYKTKVKVTTGSPPNTTTNTIDPHMFNAGQ